MHGDSHSATEIPAKGAPRGADSQARYDAFMSRSAPEDDARLRLDAFEATIRPITADDRPLLHELTVGVFWPHRAHDLDLFLSLGAGYIALDEIGRPVGSTMYFPMGGDFAMFGMMVTTPRLQSHGAGRRLLRRIMRDCAGRDLRLSATRSGYRLYHSAGFEPVGTIWQQQGVARPIHLPEPVPGLGLRALEPGDLGALRALDAHAYGADRGKVLDAVLDLSTGVVVTRGDEVCGYALMRPFGKGMVIGPVVAGDDATAMQLVAPLIRECEGRFTRLDTPLQGEHFKAFLSAAGMGTYDTVTEMRIGPSRRSETGALLYGLAAHSMG
ncbi:GNAT family N-acetyltransferase [Salipiger sp.]|uniref:GNAT family N-acetyltransferase n=1 Tax=Salipiger sp. TaxID=2078585 RepID=UPI003A97CC4F